MFLKRENSFVKKSWNTFHISILIVRLLLIDMCVYEEHHLKVTTSRLYLHLSNNSLKCRWMKMADTVHVYVLLSWTSNGPIKLCENYNNDRRLLSENDPFDMFLKSRKWFLNVLPSFLSVCVPLHSNHKTEQNKKGNKNVKLEEL